MNPSSNFIFAIIVGALWYFVDSEYGQTEGIRFWGFMLFVVGVYLSFKKELSIQVEGSNFEIKVSGWKMYLAILPALLLGGATTIFPNEVACGLNFRWYQCT